MSEVFSFEMLKDFGLPIVALVYMVKLYTSKTEEVSIMAKELKEAITGNVESRTKLYSAINRLIDHVEKESLQRQEFMVKLASKLLDGKDDKEHEIRNQHYDKEGNWKP